jgi:hypothetical protein
VVKILGYTELEWQLGPIKPKLGPAVGYGFSDRKLDYGALLQVIKEEW